MFFSECFLPLSELVATRFYVRTEFFYSPYYLSKKNCFMITLDQVLEKNPIGDKNLNKANDLMVKSWNQNISCVQHWG